MCYLYKPSTHSINFIFFLLLTSRITSEQLIQTWNIFKMDMSRLCLRITKTEFLSVVILCGSFESYLCHKIDDKIREVYIMQSLFQVIYPIIFASIHYLPCKIFNDSHFYRKFNPSLSVVYCLVSDEKKSRTSKFDNPCNSLALSMG